MSRKNQRGGNYPTDRNTDYLFEYFMNEDKFNEQLKGELDEQMKKKLERHKQPSFEKKIETKNTNTKSEEELPSNSESGSSSSNSSNNKPEVEFDSEKSGDEISEQSSVKSPYEQKIEAKPRSENKKRSEFREEIPDKPLLGESLVGDIQKYVETAEERRARAREAYSKLQDLVDKYKVKLSKPFGIDDDPDEMEAEYQMHKDRRHKNNQVKFYKQILLNIVCGVEFLNEKYDPFAFKLKDWSKQVAADMDDYTEVLEEIYEKYKDKGGKMSPEIRLLFMIIMSGVTFHLSQALFGPSGVGEAIKSNPNMLSGIMKVLTKGGGLSGLTGDAEPNEAKEVPTNTKSLLEKLRKQNSEKMSDVKSDVKNDTTTTDGNTGSKLQEELALEREKRLLAEQKADYEAKLRKMNETHLREIDTIKNQQHINSTATVIPPTQQQNLPVQNNNYPAVGQSNIVLSNATQKPRFMDEQISISSYRQDADRSHETIPPTPKKSSMQELSDELDIFDSELRENHSSKNRLLTNKKSAKQNFDVVESLDSVADVDFDDVIETSSKKRNRQIPSVRKPRNNSATRSATKSTGKKRGSETRSDLMSASKKDNIVKL